MTKEEYLVLAGQRYDSLQSLNELDSFYDYEKKYLAIWKDLGREVLERNLGKVPEDRRKKNFTTLGQISIDNQTPLVKAIMVFKLVQ